MPAYWRIDNWPKCLMHAFLSHCAEDRNDLILPVFEELRKAHIIPWIDLHHYPTGQDPNEALREGILSCRHIVYFVTPSMLQQGRGWAAAEKAFASLIQQNLCSSGTELCHVELPLFFVPRDDTVFMRSNWYTLYHKGAIFDGSASEMVDWAVSVIQSFVSQEERWGVEIGLRIEQDPHAYGSHYIREPNLKERVVCSHPAPLPPVL